MKMNVKLFSVILSLLVSFASACKDDYHGCYNLIHQCGMESAKNTMMRWCQKTCNFCSITNTSQPTVCQDTYHDCRSIQSLCGSDTVKATMQQLCPKTCNLCVGSTQPPLVTTTRSTPSSNTTVCGNPQIQQGRVIAGKTATRGSWPWQVLMVENKTPVCGGTIISPNWILTAAHCIDGIESYPWRISMRAGEHNTHFHEGTEEEIEAVKIVKHSSYNSRTLDNDIALVKLKSPFKLNNHVSTACLPISEVTAGTTCYITGWGKTKHPGDMTNILQQGKMNVVNRKTCEAHNRKTISLPVTSAMVCGGDGGLSQLSGCHGDSGGPFVCNIGGRWEVHGAVSYGSGDCRSDKSYTVFANVAYFRSWIDRTMSIY